MSFIRPVPPEWLNEGVVFKEGSVVDAYFNNGWWTGLIVVERPNGSFLVYFDDPPDIMRFIRSQLRPQADWIGSEWVKIKNKVFQHMFRTGKLVEMTREKEKIWIRALVITEIRSQGDDRRKFLIKRCTISQNSSDLAEGKHLIVDICKIRPSPPRDLCAEYSLNDYVEVVVTHGWRKGRVTEILLENKYKVYFAATKEDAIFNYTEIRLSMEWLETKSLSIEEVNRFDQMEKVDVKCILGDPELHSDLVEDVDCEFGRVVDLVKRGYRLKRQYWLNVSVDIAVAEAEVDENNYVPGIDATYQENIEFLTKKETEKSKETEAATKTNVNGQNADYELDETEVLQNYIDAKRQKIAKGKKNGVRPPREVDHLEEDDTEVEHGDKERDTSKVNDEQPQEEEEQEVDVDDGDKESENSETNEGHTQEEEEQQQEDDTEVNADVGVGAKESENPKTNEDGEVNEDASKKSVKGTKKRGRGTKGMKKGVTPPREVQQQVEDDAEVDVGAKEIENPETNEDGEVNDDASKNPVKGTKKRGRGTKDGEVNEDASKKLVKGTKKRGRGTKGMKKGVTPPREVQQQVEDDAEVDVGAKEIENPETNEKMKKGATPPREVQQQVEDDAEVDAGAKEIENPETNEDGEVNEDASKNPVKGTKKRGRGTKGMKKGVTPPREVQQQVKDDAEVDAKESENPKTNEDGEVNEDASKKHVKFTKKRGRVTKEPNVDTSKSKRQKKQEDSAADAIGRVS
ncbi:hypothetical protein HID58_048759 [Brassica napus]|uniref:Agenet domain-containing protein n=1 Tax=Brassica napus TaxID=3708 RepID=A0ABQ8B315_BRANA|nr:hypothetical protein HID58_048759 [Brassica napus]